MFSIGLSEAAMADPAYAAKVLPLAEEVGVDLLVLGHPQALPFDAQVIAAWAAPRLTRMGVVPLVSTRLGHPFHHARSLSAIDYLTGGLLGWCPVAEDGDAERLADMVLATRALWDGWDADCLIIDKESGRYLDSTKVRPSHYVGSHYKTRGPVNAMRPRQGHPLLVCNALSPFAVPGIDVMIVEADQAAPEGARRLLRVGVDLDSVAIAQAFAEGRIDGVHVDVDAALGQLPLVAQRLAGLITPSAAGGTLRERLKLAAPTQAAQEEIA